MRPHRAKPWIALGLVAGTLVAFAPALENAFVNYDTPRLLDESSGLRHGLSPAGLDWAFRTNLVGNWQPLTALSYLVDYELFGLDPAGYHRTNVVLHALAALLLFQVWAEMTGAVWRSGFVAALFAVHPAHVESVAWVAERKDVLSAVFWALAMAVYVRGVRSGSRRVLFVALPAVFALGLMAKPMLVTLPCVLLLLDDWPLDRLRRSRRRAGGVGSYDPSRVRRAVLEKLPLLALAALFSVITLVFQRELGATTANAALPFGVRVQNALLSYVAYVGDLFWPADLAVFYPYETSPPLAAVGAAAVGLAAVSALVLASLPQRRYLAVGWLWYVGTLVPVIGLIQVGSQARADRYTYLPFVGLAVMLAWGVPELSARLRLPRRAPAVAAAVALAVLSVCTWRQVRVWRSSFTLFEHTLAVTGENALAHHQLATAHWEARELDRAARHYQAALRVQPGRPSSVLGLAVVRLAQGRHDEARSSLSELLGARDPDIVRKARIALGNVAHAQGFHDTALAHYRAALEAGFDVGAANNLAWILATHPDPGRRNAAEALRLAEAALARSRETDPQLLDTLAAAAAEAGDFEQALSTSRRAMDLAREKGDPALAGAIAAHRRHYRAGRALPQP